MSEFEKWMDRAGQVADAAVKTTSEVVSRGRDKAEQVALQARIAKMQKQLGALVYALRKSGDENEPMVQWYVTEIDRLQAKINELDTPVRARGRERDSVVADVRVSVSDDAEENEDAMFRDGLGDESSEK